LGFLWSLSGLVSLVGGAGAGRGPGAGPAPPPPLQGWWASLVAWFGGLSLVDMGRNLIMGFVGGIVGSVGSVVDAVKNAVGAAIGAAKSLLGIASPSKVFAGIGDNTAAGFAEGVSSGAPEAQAALVSMVEPPVAGVTSPTDAGAAAAGATADAAGSSGGGGGGGANYADMFRGAVFNFGTGADGKAAASDFFEQWTKLVEGLGAQVGGEAPA
jgi:hypothetical protein